MAPPRPGLASEFPSTSVLLGCLDKSMDRFMAVDGRATPPGLKRKNVALISRMTPNRLKRKNVALISRISIIFNKFEKRYNEL
jgi:hypothetical protein